MLHQLPTTRRLLTSYWPLAALGLASLVVGGCSSPAAETNGQSPGDGRPTDRPLEPGEPVELDPDVPVDALRAALTEAYALDAAGLAARHAVSFQNDLGYDPLEAEGLAQLQASNLALLDEERAVLGQHGFVITPGHQFPSFFYAYLTIYGEDLPVYVSADSVLDSVHRSFSDILKDLERFSLAPQLQQLLTRMRGQLAVADHLGAQVRADLEFFLAVAEGLLDGRVPTPLTAGVVSADVAAFLDAATAASGIEAKTLFGVAREIDFTQFKPRGHYENDPRLQAYFRAMMWLGRIDFRMLETASSGEQLFRRRQLEASLALRELMDAQTLEMWQQIDATVSAFVGEHDYMVLPQLDALMADLDIQNLAGLEAFSDQQLAVAIKEGGYGAQRIASHVISKGGYGDTLPLNRSFAFFGQRYTVDSHVFSNVVFDRAGNGGVKRWLPDPLDAAFAALGNDHAINLLQDELAQYSYAPDLAAMRVLVDAHPEAYWESSLYTLWLDALRSVSPTTRGVRPDAEGLPAVARSEPWARRLLNTQLASWSQLRHDTLLYAKQSYTTGTVCEFPDAYVDPYPELFAKLGRYAARGAQLVAELSFPESTPPYVLGRLHDYFTSLAEVSAILESMAEHQRTGLPHTEEHLAFINEVVRLQAAGSGPPSLEGWYMRLFYDPERALEDDPIIADVHTDVGGVERPPNVVHVATGRPRMLVATVETCSGPRAYVGPAFAYHEVIPGGLQRLTDSEWKTRLDTAPAPDVPWMQPLLAP